MCRHAIKLRATQAPFTNLRELATVLMEQKVTAAASKLPRPSQTWLLKTSIAACAWQASARVKTTKGFQAKTVRNKKAATRTKLAPNSTSFPCCILRNNTPKSPGNKLRSKTQPSRPVKRIRRKRKKNKLTNRISYSPGQSPISWSSAVSSVTVTKQPAQLKMEVQRL
jgi:hypothetical protein